ncbi:hypothetical protein LMG19282_01465 [Cupriavidus campinensis]|uniref:Lytic transglycosylase domain-containing protein n=1 Tax=Cupriavidus campinensis TaxID=151783 RepID=A0ABY3EJ89_9BURK|nr:lytic transglycosylase domain-containing protein [Cupriavidus campinensis]TSP11008.1 lytic transglycosylase domain-containing protein [Cupriavidus campinensis]CAG2138225.1 hypothetical protein LMG19282_01465 [Cupriavidus campinensis]
MKRLRPLGAALIFFSMTSVSAQCWEAVSAKYDIPVPLLKAIAEQESHFNNSAFRREPDGKYSVCMMQILNTWFPTIQRRFGITETDLRRDACTCLDVGGWILYESRKELGPNWRSVGGYNAKTEWKRIKYANDIEKRLSKFQAGEAK